MQNYPDTIFLPFNLTSGKIRNINIEKLDTPLLAAGYLIQSVAMVLALGWLCLEIIISSERTTLICENSPDGAYTLLVHKSSKILLFHPIDHIQVVLCDNDSVGYKAFDVNSRNISSPSPPSLKAESKIYKTNTVITNSTTSKIFKVLVFIYIPSQYIIHYCSVSTLNGKV